MINRTTLVSLILAVTAPCWAVPNDVSAIREAQTVVIGGPAASGIVFDGKSGGSNAIESATSGALKTGDLTVAEADKASMRLAAVPAPQLGRGAKSKKGGFFSGKGIWFSLGGAAIGAVAGLLLGGGLPGALIGAAAGALVGFLLSKLLS